MTQKDGQSIRLVTQSICKGSKCPLYGGMFRSIDAKSNKSSNLNENLQSRMLLMILTELELWQ